MQLVRRKRSKTVLMYKPSDVAGIRCRTFAASLTGSVPTA